MSDRYVVTPDVLDAAAIEALVRDDAHGAVVTFHGVVRAQSDDGRSVRGLAYEAHETMALAEFVAIAREAVERFGDCEIAMHHRTGELRVGETAVVVAVAAAHRSHAFDACRYAIDQLKERAAIWKREDYGDGTASWKEHA